jgi:hypothetical protein
MAKVVREMVEKAGINVDELVWFVQKNKTAPKRFPHRDSDDQLERELIANN